LSFLKLGLERLWRDLWMGVTSVFYHILHTLEEQGMLDLSSTLHLFCCHYVFLPRLQANLNVFREGWDNHWEQSKTSHQTNCGWLVRWKIPLTTQRSEAVKQRKYNFTGIVYPEI